MNFEDFKAEFDTLFAQVSDDELVKAFADMGCEVEVVEPPQPAAGWIPMMLNEGLVEWKGWSIPANSCTLVCSSGWSTDHSFFNGTYSERRTVEAEAASSDRSVETISAADSNRLALAA